MVFRSCLCSGKYNVTPQLYRLSTVSRFPKYPGIWLHQPFRRQSNTNTIDQISHQLEKVELAPTFPTISKSPSQQTLDKILNNACSSEQAKAWYSDMVNWPPKKIAFLFSNKLKQVDYSERLRPVFLEAASYWPIYKIRAIMSMLGRGCPQLKLDLFNTILLPRYTVDKEIRHIIRALPRKGKPADVLPLYNAAINACENHEEPEHINRILKTMKHRGYQPDTATYNILIRMNLSSYDKNKTDDVKGLDLYHSLLKEGFIPNQATYNIFIKYSAQHQQWDMLGQWLDLMEQNGLQPNDITLRIIFQALSKRPREKGLLRVFQRVLSMSPSALETEEFSNTVVASFLDDNNNKAAMDILNEVFQLKKTPSIYAYNLLLRALCQNNRVDDAQLVLDTMLMSSDSCIPKPDIVSFTTVIHGFIRKQGQFEEVRSLYESLLKQDLHTNNVMQSVILYAMIKYATTMNKEDIGKVKLMFESIITHNHQAGSYPQHGDKALSEMIVYNMMMDFYFIYYHRSKQLRNRIPKEPFLLLKEATEQKKLKPTLSTLNIFVRGLASFNNDLNAAERVIKVFQARGIEKDEKTVWYMATTAYRQGKINRARQLIDSYDTLVHPIKGSGLIRLRSKLG